MIKCYDLCKESIVKAFSGKQKLRHSAIMPNLVKLEDKMKKYHDVRSGIRTHAHRSGLRPERSALDLSAILTATGL